MSDERKDVEAATGARKSDGGKDPWHLLPTDAVRQIVRVLAFGAKKYAERNWERGLPHSRTYAATQRHLTAWWEGETLDAETGISHLAHAACEVLFALAFEVRGRDDLDDRPARWVPQAPTPASAPLRTPLLKTPLAVLIGESESLSADAAWAAAAKWVNSDPLCRWIQLDLLIGFDGTDSPTKLDSERAFRAAWSAP